MADEYKESLRKFELKFHDEVFNWIIAKLETSEPLDMLDISCDEAVFGGILSQRMKASKFVVAIRDPTTNVQETSADIRKIQINSTDSLTCLESLGKFDVVLLKDMLHEVEDMETFFGALKTHTLKGDSSKIFILSRPKNPPLPVPDPAMGTWRKISPTQEKMIAASKAAGYKEDFYAASCPIQVERKEWGKLLKGRSMPAVKLSPKCTDKEINEFVGSGGKGRDITFEEKYLILKLRIKTDADVAQEAKEQEEANRKANEDRAQKAAEEVPEAS